MKMLFTALAAAILAAALPAAPALAQGAVTLDEAVALSPGDYRWRDPGGGAAPSVVISLPDQRAYVYRGQTLVAVSTVSTGKEGHDTPIGSFPVLQKREMHKSSLYDDAPMPFMQRLTWDGVALHAGANPGFADSHGCVRLPAGFARKLFGVTRIGTSVTVVDASVDGVPVPRTAAEVSAASRVETASANADALAAMEGAN